MHKDQWKFKVRTDDGYSWRTYWRVWWWPFYFRIYGYEWSQSDAEYRCRQYAETWAKAKRDARKARLERKTVHLGWLP